MEKEINEDLDKTMKYLLDEVIPSLKRDNKKLQQRIDKALKFIKKQKPWWEEWHYDMCGVDDDIKEIENILRGDE